MLQNWILAIRPKTLPAAIAPVMIGSGMAFGDGLLHVPSALAALLAALCIQIATNLVNDYCDFKKGADTADRQGPIRVTQAGLVPPKAVLTGAIAFFALAALAALYLMFQVSMVEHGPMIILAIAVTSILSGIFYTAGKKPLGYQGLGDIFVFIFFGPVAVAGTYFVQTLDMNWAVIAAGVAPGFLSTAILAVNNLRDIQTDQRAGKRTLAVRYGRSFAMTEYLFCIIAAGFGPVLVYLITQDHAGILMASVIPFFALPAIRTVFTEVEGIKLNKVLASTGKLLFTYSFLFALGWVLWSR